MNERKRERRNGRVNGKKEGRGKREERTKVDICNYSHPHDTSFILNLSASLLNCSLTLTA